jgi:hypothetical protein
LTTWKIRLVLILVKHLLAAARNDVAFVESVFPFKEKKPHFTVAHWNHFTSSLEGNCYNRCSRAIDVDTVDLLSLEKDQNGRQHLPSGYVRGRG